MEYTGEEIDWADATRHGSLLLECNMVVVRLEVAIFDFGPVAIPGRGDKDLNSRSLSGTKKEKVAIQIEDRVRAVGTDDSVYAFNGLIKR